MLAGRDAEGRVSVVVMMPVPLSYFSPLVGGLPGQPYAWAWSPPTTGTPSTEQARAWLRSHTGAGPDDPISPPSRRPGSISARSAELPPRLDRSSIRADPAWFVMQNRPGAWSPLTVPGSSDREPVFTVRKLGVPLVWVFPYAIRDDSIGYPERPSWHHLSQVRPDARVVWLTPDRGLEEHAVIDHAWLKHAFKRREDRGRDGSVLSRGLGGSVRRGAIADGSRVGDRACSDRLADAGPAGAAFL